MCGDSFSSEVERHVFWFDLRMIVIFDSGDDNDSGDDLGNGGDVMIFVVMVNVQLPFLPPIAWGIMVVAQMLIMIFDKDI